MLIEVKKILQGSRMKIFSDLLIQAELVLLLPGTKNLFFFHPTIRKEPHLETYTQSWIHKSYPSLTNINFIL